ncbi:MAG: amidohydrolase [Megasphaera sp.]|jgi:amidohydrolase|nr:amidohydrolase [Megasphaera sp.]
MNVKETVMQHFEELKNIRRYCHEHPELSAEEFETMKYIEKKLDSYGIAYHYVKNGGIFGWIDGKGNGKTILLRADIDALPIVEDEKNLSCPRTCISQNKGVMHACGHDGHIAMLLMEAKLLQEQKDNWPGKVILMFEEGEEGSDAVRYLLPYLENESGWNIDTCYATHVRWDIPAGKMAVCHGPAMAGGFGFKIKIKGHGGHGSRPDLAQSPIDCFTAFYKDLQALRMRAVSPMETLTVSVGSLHSGDVLNVIPNDLIFSGTSRFFSYDNAGKMFYEEFLKLLENDCKNYNCSYEIIHMKKPLYETRNAEICVTRAEQAIKKYLGDAVLTPCEPWMASETMALTMRLYPGVLTFTGIANGEKGCGANHHTPEFDLDEDGLIYGVTTAVGYALDYLTEQPDIPFHRNIISMEDLVSRNL